MRAVVDTNVLVRALIKPHGTVGPVLLRLRHGDYTLLYAGSLLAAIPIVPPAAFLQMLDAGSEDVPGA